MIVNKVGVVVNKVGVSFCLIALAATNLENFKPWFLKTLFLMSYDEDGRQNASNFTAYWRQRLLV